MAPGKDEALGEVEPGLLRLVLLVHNPRTHTQPQSWGHHLHFADGETGG